MFVPGGAVTLTTPEGRTWMVGREPARSLTSTSRPSRDAGSPGEGGDDGIAEGGYPLGEEGHVPPLEPGPRELVLRRPAAALARDGGGAVRGAAGDLVHPALAREEVREADDDHPVVEERRVEGEDG